MNYARLPAFRHSTPAPDSYLGGTVRRFTWGRGYNVPGKVKVYRNGREWQEGATLILTVFGFGVARYDRRDPAAPRDAWHPLLRRDGSGRVTGKAEGWSFGFFRVEPDPSGQQGAPAFA